MPMRAVPADGGAHNPPLPADVFRSEPFIADTATPTGPGLLARLRADTRAEHEAIEQTLDLMDGDLTLDRYRRRIEQFYGYYRPLEEALLARRAWLSPWLEVVDRLKTPLLAADLVALGRPLTAALPLCETLPGLQGPPECFGCLYVLEGSTLGGQVISRHLRQTLAVTPPAGGLFFDGYGARTGSMWQHFRTALTGFSGDADAGAGLAETQDRVVAAARLTFQTLHRWCRDGASRKPIP